MNRISILFISIIFLSLSCKQATSKSSKEEDLQKKVLHHMVAFEWKKDAPLDSITKSAYNTLGKIDFYTGPFSYGDNSVSLIDQEYSSKNTHVMHLKFRSAYDRDSVYMPSELHMSFGKQWGPYMKSIKVYDWWE